MKIKCYVRHQNWWLESASVLSAAEMRSGFLEPFRLGRCLSSLEEPPLISDLCLYVSCGGSRWRTELPNSSLTPRDPVQLKHLIISDTKKSHRQKNPTGRVALLWFRDAQVEDSWEIKFKKKKRWFYTSLTPANVVLLCDFLQREELDIRNKSSHLHSCISQMVCVFQHMYMARCSMIIRRVCRTNGTTAAAAVQHKSPWAEIISTSLCVWWNLQLGRHRFHIREPTSCFHTHPSRCECKLVDCGLSWTKQQPELRVKSSVSSD